MPLLEYGKYILISRPLHDAQLGGWVPHASITWPQKNESHYHEVNVERIFETEAGALRFGFNAARAWIDENLVTQEAT
jgi:hypothetical protein